MKTRVTIPWSDFGEKHKRYIHRALKSKLCVAEGAIRSGKTIDHCIAAAAYLERCSDAIHLASGSTMANAKLNIGVCNGFGLENLFRGRCKWGKYRDNEALFIQTQTGEKIVVFAGGGKSDSYKRILGNSYGLWIATEINEHYDSNSSRESFIKVAMGRQTAALEPLTLWDLNPCAPKHRIYRDYIDKYRDDCLSGYLYEHFTIDDNLSISPERKADIKARYNPQSVWYKRDIQGQRCVAEGLVYPQFADHQDWFVVDMPPALQFGTIGVDFGGTGSAHSFTFTGFTPGMRQIVVVSEYYHENMQRKVLSPSEVELAFVKFCQRVLNRCKVYEAFCDSAEQTMMQGLRIALLKARLPIEVKNARKGPINERIAFYNSLMAQGRFLVCRECEHTIDALASAMYDGKDPTEDVRLDDGTTNIDSLDSMEYSTETVQEEIMYLTGR